MERAHHVLISSMKNEGPFILEWVAHHLVLGFDRICVASNDCSDGSDVLLGALDQAGYVSHVPNVLAPDDIPQHAGYSQIRRTQDIDSADWLMMLDADEFLNVHVGNNRVQDLTDRASHDIDIISLCAMGFTNAPELNWRPGRISPRFENRLALQHKTNAALKTITRNPARFKGVHNHHMVGFRGTDALQVLHADGVQNVLKPDVPIWKQLRNCPVHDISHRLAHYNHYAVKTWDSFMLRRLRGRGAVANQTPEQLRHTDAYFEDRNQTAGKDLSIQRYDSAVVAMMDDMLTDRKVRRSQNNTNRLYGLLSNYYRV